MLPLSVLPVLAVVLLVMGIGTLRPATTSGVSEQYGFVLVLPGLAFSGLWVELLSRHPVG